MNGTGGGGGCARNAERGKELVPVMRNVVRKQVPAMRNAERKQVPAMRSISGRVFGAAPGPPPETSQGGGWPRTGRGVSATRQSLCGATSITLEWSFTAFTRLACKCAVLMLS